MVGAVRRERDPGAGRGEGSHRSGAAQVPQRPAAAGHQPVQAIRPGILDLPLRASIHYLDLIVNNLCIVLSYKIVMCCLLSI